MTEHHHDLPKVRMGHLVDRMEERPPAWFYGLTVLLAVIGVAGFVVGLLGDPGRAWTALVWNWVFFSGVSVAGAVAGAAAVASNGRWVRPLQRLAESLTGFLPVSFVIMILLFFGLEHVYHWIEHPVESKAAYLDETFFIVRQAVMIAVLYGVALVFVYWSLRPDLGRLGDRVGGWRANLHRRMTGGWRGLDVEVERSRRARSKLAPALALLYAVVWSFVAFDWVMSADPHWFSTLFGAWVFMSAWLGALGATAILVCTLGGYRSFGDVLGAHVRHDIGKMVFAFTIFWTYLFFAQYLVIWYGRLPEETHFVKLRLWQAYEPVAIIVLLAVFVVPFLGLLGVAPKRNPATLTAFSVVSLIGLWLVHFLLVTPSVFPETLAFGWIELAVAAGMFGLFALSVLAFLAAFPAFAISSGLPYDEQTEEMIATQEPHA